MLELEPGFHIGAEALFLLREGYDSFEDLLPAIVALRSQLARTETMGRGDPLVDRSRAVALMGDLITTFEARCDGRRLRELAGEALLALGMALDARPVADRPPYEAPASFLVLPASPLELDRMELRVGVIANGQLHFDKAFHPRSTIRMGHGATNHIPLPRSAGIRSKILFSAGRFLHAEGHWRVVTVFEHRGMFVDTIRGERKPFGCVCPSRRGRLPIKVLLRCPRGKIVLQPRHGGLTILFQFRVPATAEEPGAKEPAGSE